MVNVPNAVGAGNGFPDERLTEQQCLSAFYGVEQIQPAVREVQAEIVRMAEDNSLKDYSTVDFGDFKGAMTLAMRTAEVRQLDGDVKGAKSALAKAAVLVLSRLAGAMGEVGRGN